MKNQQFLKALFILICLSLSCGNINSKKFTHPGILHTEQRFKQIKNLINNKIQPSYASFLILKAHPCSQADYQMKGPFEIISRDGDPKNFGFNLPKNFVKKSKFHFRFKIIFSPAVIVLWKKIQVQFNKNPKLKANPEYSWFLNFDFEKSNNFIKEWYAKVTVCLKKLLKK